MSEAASEKEIERAALEVEGSCASLARRARGITGKSVVAAQHAMTKFRESKDWSKATAIHWVALWFWCYDATYGAPPSMAVADWKVAACLAAKQHKSHFGEDWRQALDYMRWAWSREERNIEWRQAHEKEITPLGYRQMFGGKFADVWRVNKQRPPKKGGAH